ncbi:MAG TPA: beta-N-acetylglucosaminidase domain-containing protein [Acidimicrobiales bacterium]|nr:beta-N-acetylglucosaminidase domain-containing protein [Acidimicrobiales bacterium]
MANDADRRRLLGMVGEDPFAPPAPIAPSPGDVVPQPRSYDRGPVVGVRQTFVSLDGPAASTAVCASGLFRAGVATATDAGGYPITFRIDPAAGSGEGYRLDATPDGMTVAAATDAGLVRGATTARQLVWRDGDAITVATGLIHDSPTVPLRMLAGWGLYRDHDMEWALEVALEGKYNRVLYNWWTATADEHLTARDTALVHSARDLGIELVLELRRQALGPGFSIDDPAAVERLLAHYDDAVAHGFRAFGFLFDDTDHDAFELEFDLLARIVDRVTDRLGEEPEFYFCPRFYWFPGQADYSWFGDAVMASMLGTSGPRTMKQAVKRQREYHRQMAGVLAEKTNVYLANWWSGTPADWDTQLGPEWTDVVGRPPVFWDNQQMNDYRAGAIIPIPFHQRPPAFAGALAGYTLNSSRPLSGYAPASVTAGDWAWNPDGYDPAKSFGTAIARFFGPAAVEPLAAWCQLFDDLFSPRAGMEQHYRAVRRLADEGTGAELRVRLADISRGFDAAEAALLATAHPMARDAFAHLRREIDRLLLDLRLAELVAGEPSPAALAEADYLVAAIEEILISRLPPVPELHDAARHGFPDHPIPGVSWHMHFVAGPMQAGPHRLLASLHKRAGR